MSSKNILKQFEIIDTEEKAYWLGFLYADGYVSNNEDKIELCLAEKDYDHVAKFKNFIGLPNKICYRAKTKAYRFSFRSQNCKADLIKQGCIPKKSLILKFPTEEQVPKHLLRHFIRGYFDGDGWFTNTDNSFQVGIIGSEDFINEYLNILPEGIIRTNKIQNVHRENGAKRYMFSGINDVTIFLNWIYKDAKVYLNRKYEHYLEFLENEKLS